MSIAAEPHHTFRSGKNYVHSVGLSCCFRQWRAESHCRFLHGYSIKVECTFKGHTLDARNWLVDFGSLKSFKGWLEDTFDHKTLVAEDDPELKFFQVMDKNGLIQLRVLPSVGCEAMAFTIFQYLDMWLQSNGYGDRISLEEVRVYEHDANWASYGKE
jgi:6-pyruvoyltetrahydropterin/6-carboxytetrahydropterin synthase